MRDLLTVDLTWNSREKLLKCQRFSRPGWRIDMGNLFIIYYAEFHTARKLGDVKWRFVFRPLRSIVGKYRGEINHSDNDVRGLND